MNCISFTTYTTIFVLSTTMKKITNPKYLFFILKNKLFETLAFLPLYPIRVGYMATRNGKRRMYVS